MIDLKITWIRVSPTAGRTMQDRDGYVQGKVLFEIFWMEAGRYRLQSRLPHTAVRVCKSPELAIDEAHKMLNKFMEGTRGRS